MTKLQLLNAYLTERLAAVVKEVLAVVEDTVTEYREEAARSRRENEGLRRQLRDILLLEAEAEWLRSTRSSLGFASPEQRPCDVDPRPRSEGPEAPPDRPGPPARERLDPALTVQNERPPEPVLCPGDAVPAREPVLKPDPQRDSPLPSLSCPSPPGAASGPQTHGEGPAPREEPRGPDRVKREPEELKVSDGETDALTHRHRAGPEELHDTAVGGRGVPELVHRCPRCGEAFGHAGGLRLHLQQKRKTYACDWCCKSFAQSADLRRHLRTHTGERPHRCTFCSKSFSQRGNLRRHLRIHTGERPYGCPDCCRTFSDGDTMKKHKRTHLGEEPYRCDRCNRGFGSAGGLQIHFKRDACFVANAEDNIHALCSDHGL